MKQLALQNGDLVLGQGGFATVRGPNKVRQDLSCALREPIGTDRFHRAWGSTLQSYIGDAVGPDTLTMIESEVYRVVQNYMVTRAGLLQQEYIDNLRPNFDAGEIISAITGVDVQQQEDRCHVRVSLTTLSQERLTLVATVEAP